MIRAIDGAADGVGSGVGRVGRHRAGRADGRMAYASDALAGALAYASDALAQIGSRRTDIDSDGIM